MLKVKIYRVVGDSSKLRTEEIRDEKGNVVFVRDHESDEVADKRMEYDQENRLVAESQILDDQEIEKRTFTYQANDEIKEEQHFIQGELYSETKFQEQDKGYLQTILEDGEVIEYRQVETTENGHIVEVKDGSNKLLQKSIKVFNKDKTQSITEVFDEENGMNGKLIEFFDAKNRLVKAEEYGPDDEFYGATQLTFENDLLTKEEYSNYNKNDVVSTVNYAYDSNKKLVQLEERDQSGNLQRASVWVYNDQGRLEIEKGLKVGNYDAVFGTGENSNNYELRYEYEG